MITQDKPGTVFFTGDIVGTDLLERLHMLFYGGVYNPMKKLLKDNPYPTNDEILNFKIIGGTISTGVDNIVNFLKKLDLEFRIKDKAKFAKKIVRYDHFGHFCSNLPQKIRDKLKMDMSKNAEAVYQLMDDYTQKGWKVIIVEGNWDARTPLDWEFRQKCVATRLENRPFIFKHFIELRKNPNIYYFDTATTIETEDYIFSIWPFDAVIDVQQQLPTITKDKRKRIMISHTQINKDLIKGETPITKETKKINRNMQVVIDLIKPDIIVHGHMDEDSQVNQYLYQNIPVFHIPLRTATFIDFENI